MCDFFDDFDYDGLDDMVDDFIEDAFLDEYIAPDMETELRDELNTPEPEPSKSSFDEEVFILGAMIVGQALDEKEQRKKKKPK